MHLDVFWRIFLYIFIYARYAFPMRSSGGERIDRWLDETGVRSNKDLQPILLLLQMVYIGATRFSN